MQKASNDFGYDMCLFDDSKEISLKELMKFNPVNFEKETISKRQDDLMLCPFIANSIYLPNKFLKSYLLLFAASSIARYRPIPWRSILNGESKIESEFYISSRDGVLDYVLGEQRGLSLIRQTAIILEKIERGMPLSRSKHGDTINS